MTQKNLTLIIILLACNQSSQAQLNPPVSISTLPVSPFDTLFSDLKYTRFVTRPGSFAQSHFELFNYPDYPSDQPLMVVSTRAADCWGLQVENVTGNEAGGILIETVEPNTMGDLAGLQPGDIVRAANDQPVAWWHELHRELKNCDTTYLTVHRSESIVQLMIRKPSCFVRMNKNDLTFYESKLKVLQVRTDAPTSPVQPVTSKPITEENMLLKVSPNPSGGIIEVRFAAGSESFSLQIASESGEVLHQETAKGGDYLRTFNLSDLDSGWVVITIIQQEKIYSQRVIIVH